MALIRARCTTCGDIELTTRQVHIRICIDTDEATYAFRCPTCNMSDVRPATERIVEDLLRTDIELVEWSLPFERCERTDNPILTDQDEDNFRELLKTDDWFDALQRLDRS